MAGASGPSAYMAHEVMGPDKFIEHGRAVDVYQAARVENYALFTQGPRGHGPTINPLRAYRKSKVNEADASFPVPRCGLSHTLYLELPAPLIEGTQYTLKIAGVVSGQEETRSFVFDSTRSVSEALHVNLLGYNPRHTVMKSADLYFWRGDGGARDYGKFEGRPVFLIEEDTSRLIPSGKVVFWRKSGSDY